MSQMTLPGLHQHGKTGDFFIVQGLAKDCTNGSDKKMVVYTLARTSILEDVLIFTREESEFNENVMWSDGIYRPRFCRCLQCPDDKTYRILDIDNSNPNLELELIEGETRQFIQDEK